MILIEAENRKEQLPLREYKQEGVRYMSIETRFNRHWKSLLPL